MSVTGIRLGTISIGRNGTSISGDKPSRPPDFEAGAAKTPVWVDPPSAEGHINVSVGEGMSITLGPGQSGSMSMDGLSLRWAGYDLAVNGEKLAVEVPKNAPLTEPAAPPPPHSRFGAASPQVTGRAAELRGATATVGAIGNRALSHMSSALEQAATVLEKPAAASAFARGLASAPWDDDRVAKLKAHGEVASAEVPGVLAAFQWDDGRNEALGVIGALKGADLPAALAAFQWDDGRLEALRALKGKVQGPVDEAAVRAAFSYPSEAAEAAALLPATAA